MGTAIIAFIACALGAAIGLVAAERRHNRLLLGEPIESDPELRLVDIAERKQALYRELDGLDAEEGFIIETWDAGKKPVPSYLAYAIEKPAF